MKVSMMTFSVLAELFLLLERGRMRTQDCCHALCVGAGAKREANKHQLQAGSSLQIMSFGYSWAIDVTILRFSNDAHVGHQLRLSLPLALAFSRSPSVSLLVLALAVSSSFSPCRLSLFSLSISSLDAMRASWDLIRTRWTRCRNCPKGSENVGSCQACGESGILQ